MKIKSEESAIAEVDMTPMIDIVFQLIAFFMVITNFEQTQADERVKLPKDQLARPAEVVNPNDMVLNIGYIRDEQGDNISGPHLFYAGTRYNMDEVPRILKREAKLLRDIDKDPLLITVILRADKETPTGDIQEIIKHAQAAGFEKFSLSATQIRE